MQNALVQAKKLLKENPNITPEEMFHRLHVSGYDAVRTVYAVYTVLQTPLDSLCRITVKEYRQPLIGKDSLCKALEGCGFAAEDVKKEVENAYPADTARYAVCLSGNGGRPHTVCNPAYDIGTGDFTAEGWVKPASGGGTLLSRKPTDGGWGNGGFLLVLKPDGTIKLATDDGMGFYEINTEPVKKLYDGGFHHILGRRKSGVLEIYVDFVKIDAQVRTDRFADLDINNRLGITVGAVEQRQEPYNELSGRVGECRIWNRAVSYASKKEWADTDYVTPGIIAMWGFWGKSGDDYSEVSNALDVGGFSFEPWTL